MPIGLSPIPSGVSGRALEGVGPSTRGEPESGHWGLATVEAEHELSQIDGEVFRSNAMVGSGQPGLEVGKAPMDSEQGIPWVVRASLDLGLMVVAHGSRRLVAGEPIRNDGASLDDIGLDKSCQPVPGGCRDHGKLDPSGALSPDFYGTRNQDLVGCPTSSLSMLGATDVMKRALSRVAPPSVKRRTRSRDARTSRIEQTALRLWGLVVRGQSGTRGDGDGTGGRWPAMALRRTWKGDAGSARGSRPGPRKAKDTAGGVCPAARGSRPMTKGTKGWMAHGLRAWRDRDSRSAGAGTAATMRTPPAPQWGQRVTSLPVSRSNGAFHVSGSTGGGEAATVAEGPPRAPRAGAACARRWAGRGAERGAERPPPPGGRSGGRCRGRGLSIGRCPDLRGGRPTGRWRERCDGCSAGGYAGSGDRAASRSRGDSSRSPACGGRRRDAARRGRRAW